jgi:Flp pilus assembly protein TadG
MESYRRPRSVRTLRASTDVKPEVQASVPVTRSISRKRHVQDSGQSGQSLVEFSLVLTPLFFILLGIIQFGFIFNTYVTMTNASRDAARLGTIYVYDRTGGMTKETNDLARNESIKAAVLTSMNMLGKTAPNFSVGSTWTQSGTTYTNGDLIITYDLPAGVTETDTRVGQEVTVKATYHQDLIIPLISAFLPKDAGGRMTLVGEVTMVIN